jgi:hypothetical protein
MNENFFDFFDLAVKKCCGSKIAQAAGPVRPGLIGGLAEALPLTR